MLLQLTRQRHGFALRQSPVSIDDRAEKLKIRNDDVAAGEQGDDLLFLSLLNCLLTVSNVRPR